MNERRHELFCTECRNYVQFTMDLSVDGEYEIQCPNCHHLHYRIVKDDEVTEARWRSSGPGSLTAWNVTSTATTTASVGLNYAWISSTGGY